ncbi:eukaryotic translation initiation factor 2 subunit gamma [Coemansia sp. RSA 518]|nr:eukaryotic translation initiation factor 2 subunit gamma [Coemansia sp. RSA 788]KAJ2174602.1 eukaryotic translation initiation factor 2 subunit gamma [Coemansia sp. RSA 560]KAJ2200570.1 eukaryotic translation initiation factor 2 subunit gamma [Coemansia sp. RSA 522]KAJ2208400.1 eukaryotic translation initiation factor 2 subunit gamma [Coemansia sp. RSA 521]KAJ2221752.1 eukaryotic translation initiation factor 2 subunit gamma [Coemansia sp. RSA 520]KAJ2230465.1 eukaryotic translation initiat
MANTNSQPSFAEAMENQATINIGIIGHVAHGKSALVRSLTGINTIRFKQERERNITMKIGYANAKLYKCNNALCPRPKCFKAYSSHTTGTVICDRPTCGGQMQLVRHVSFVDCPGHDVLMQNMLNGAAVMDAAILLVAANEACPQPQTAENLAAVETMNLQHIVVVQNKCDLVSKDQATMSFNQIKQFTNGTSAQESTVVPISAEMKVNVDAVVEQLCQQIPMPVRDYASDPRMVVIRSFDINRPGDTLKLSGKGASGLKGGVAGGSITRGVLRVNDVVEIRPGLVTRDSNNHIRVRPLRTRVESLGSESTQLKFAVPGGLIGVGTLLDPFLCRQDKLVGNVLGKPDSMPKVFIELTIHFTLLRRLLGIAGNDSVKETQYEQYMQDNFGDSSRLTKVSKFKKHDVLQINVGACTGLATVVGVKDDLAKLKLERPVCADIGESIALSRKFNGSFRLIGWAKIVKGKALMLD